MRTLTRDTLDKIFDKDLYELLERKSRFSEYIEGTYEEHFNNLISEILELKTEIDISGDIKSEVMDVLYQIGQILNKMNKDGLLEVDFKQHKRKIIGRSPNLKQGKKVPREIEQENWYKLKSKQK